MLGGVVWTLSVAALLLLDPAHPRATQVIVISRYFLCEVMLLLGPRV